VCGPIQGEFSQPASNRGQEVSLGKKKTKEGKKVTKAETDEGGADPSGFKNIKWGTSYGKKQQEKHYQIKEKSEPGPNQEKSSEKRKLNQRRRRGGK